MIDELSRDARHAIRALRASPGFAIVAILSLGLGIGANTAIFSIIDTLMWRALPVANPDQLVIVGTSGIFPLTYSHFERLRDAPSGAALSAIVRTDRYNVAVGATGRDAATIDDGPVRLALVSGDYFATVGAAAIVGRALTRDDDREGAAPVAIISDAYWKRRFERAPDAIGRTLTMTDTAYEIVGVAQPAFTGEWIGRPADVWVPIVAQPHIMAEIPLGLPNTGVTIVGRVRDVGSRESAQAVLQVAYARELRERLGPNPDRRQLQDLASARITVDSGARGYSPQRRLFGQSLTILMFAVGLVLLIACANIANLMLARADAHRRDLSVRLALGATRARLARQSLIESLIVAMIAGALGVVVARWADAGLAAFMRTDPAGRAVGASLDLDTSIDVRWLVFTAAISCLTAALFGLLPAIHGSKMSLMQLGARGADSAVRGHLRPGKLLVIPQVAFSFVLLVGAGLFTRTLYNLSAQDLGFARDHLLLVWALPGQTGGRGAAAAPFWQSVVERLASLPGVVSVGASNQGVLNGAEAGGGSAPGVRVEGEPPAATGVPGWRSFVTPGFFRALGIPLIAGRDFTERDVATAQRVVILNQTFARHYFGDRNPVGRRIWFTEDTGAPTEIIGVVQDSTGGTPREVAQPPGLTYFSSRDKEAARRLRTMTIAVRTSGNPITVAPHIRRALRELDPNLPVVKIDTIDEQLADVLIQERLMATLSAFFGVTALLLACLGLYGVVAYSVSRRTNEIGIRIALGATRQRVLGMVLGESLWLIAVGLAIGIPVALASARVVAARLFGLSATDPITIGLAAVMMIVVAIAAALIPAGRASRVDPLVALRYD